jgi:D-3-phosphoglycerate dehydrogenase
MTGRCLFSAPFSFMPGVCAEYRKIMPTEFKEIWSEEELRDQPDTTAWVVNPGQRFIVGAGVLKHFPRLQVIVTPSTGRNHIDSKACADRGIAVYGLLDDRDGLERISSSAEFTFLHLLNVLRRLDRAVAEVRDGRWRHREDWLRGRELQGKRVGLVGMGRIGRRLARYARAFDAEVSYHDPNVQRDDLPALPLPALFEQSDVVCVCCVLTSETTGLIDRALLDRLKPGAALVNTSRGEVVNESDLAAFLRARPDVTVGVDVLSGEVTNTHFSSPLLEFVKTGQLVTTPHIAGATVESQEKAALVALGLLRKHLGQGAG